MVSSRKKIFFKKLLSIFSVVRGQNLLVLLLAQYLASIFIFSPKKSISFVLSDLHLHFLVIATLCVVSAGYIINNFYDLKIDEINRPFKTEIDSIVNQKTKLNLYFLLNFIGCFFGLLVSLRAAIFFSVYIFGIWIYSHKLKKYPFVGIISVSILTILPFFTVFIYYKNFSSIIFIHAIFLFLIIIVRELIKDLENLKGSLVNNYNTFSVKYGEDFTKKVSLFVLLLTIIPILVLFSFPEISFMKYYFYFAGFVILLVAYSIYKSKSRKDYRLIHNILKILLLIGVFSLVFIDTSILIEKVINKIN